MNVRIRPLEERDLADADRIVRVAFGTFIGLPDPSRMFGDADYAYTRHKGYPQGALAAELDGRLVGSNFAANWGSIGFFGPLSIEPALWDKGVAKQLLDRTMELFREWGCSHLGLFTFSDSAKHVGLYQKFGFWPRYLTAVMSKPLAAEPSGTPPRGYAQVSKSDRDSLLAQFRELTNEIHQGLDLSREIRSVHDQKLGDTIVRINGSKVSSFAICHTGPRTEAGSGVCYVKFAAVRPSSDADKEFAALLADCEHFGVTRGAQRLIAGVNTARVEAYRAMLGRGYRTEIQGIAMQSGGEPGYNRAGVYLIDDWR